MDKGEYPERGFYFVRLQVPDHMPDNILLDQGMLLLGFLYTVLTDVQDAILQGFTDTLDRHGFANRNDRDVFWIAFRPMGSPGNALFDICDILCNAHGCIIWIE